MLDNQIRCNNCGKINDRGHRYCIECGKALETSSLFPRETEYTSTASSVSSTKPSKTTNYQNLYKVLIFFGVVFFVNFILAFMIMSGFSLTGNSYFPIFFGSFFLSLLIVGIFWGAIRYSKTGETAAGCGAIILAIILISILLPIYIINALGPIVSAMAEQVGNSINEALNNFFSRLFEDVEIPGFEPFLFIGFFLSLSIFIVYRYHLTSKKKS